MSVLSPWFRQHKKKERSAFVEMPTGLSPSKERRVPYYSPNFHVQMSQKDKLK